MIALVKQRSMLSSVFHIGGLTIFRSLKVTEPCAADSCSSMTRVEAHIVMAAGMHLLLALSVEQMLAI